MSALRATATTIATVFFMTSAHADDTAPKMSVMKTEFCGCCNAWIDHIEDHGMHVEEKSLSQGALNQFKAKNGIAREHASCHTGVIDGYVIEGHVPASDIARLLKERPDALGLSVPRMPIGSPGMEMGDERDAYDVLLIQKDGEAEVFSSYEAQ